jgi:Flp pilus assembly protein TadB
LSATPPHPRPLSLGGERGERPPAKHVRRPAALVFGAFIVAGRRGRPQKTCGPEGPRARLAEIQERPERKPSEAATPKNRGWMRRPRTGGEKRGLEIVLVFLLLVIVFPILVVFVVVLVVLFFPVVVFLVEVVLIVNVFVFFLFEIIVF